MSTAIRIPRGKVLPDPAEVLRLQQMPPAGIRKPHVAELLRASRDLLLRCAAPQGLLEQVSIEDFAAIYAGEGENEADTPLARIFLRAQRLDLFAVTLGPEVTQWVEGLFDRRDFALGAMLDATASAAAEEAADHLQRQLEKTVAGNGGVAAWRKMGLATMRYSPGYCGWHVSGQGKLFARLRPDRVGIRLRKSFLMEPLKSVSGVVVTGRGEIHVFEDDFPFCAECRTRECRARIRRLRVGG
jgi:hypothetical protein